MTPLPPKNTRRKFHASPRPRAPALHAALHHDERDRADERSRAGDGHRTLADIGRFRIPTLHGLAAGAPYFHDGSAATLNDVVRFYDDLFNTGRHTAERDALVAFMRAL
jgi:cytochrome c peroxidase